MNNIDKEPIYYGDTLPQVDVTTNKKDSDYSNRVNLYRWAFNRNLVPTSIEQLEEINRQKELERAEEHARTVSEKKDYRGLAKFMAGITMAPAVSVIAPAAKTVISDITGVGLPFWRNVAKDVVAGSLGSEAMNLGSEITSGKTVDQIMNESLQQLGVNKTVSNVISPFFNPGGWLTWGLSNKMYNNLRNTFTPSGTNTLKHSNISSPTAISSLSEKAPFPVAIDPYHTYKPFHRQMFEGMKNVQLQKRAFQSYGNYSWIDHGIYDNPDWKEFYETILKPLNPNSELPKTKPRLVNFSNQSSFEGLFIPEHNVSLIDLSGNKSTGIHEYISHGTDDFANHIPWERTFYQGNDPLIPKYFNNSLDWYEQRATVNEARFQIYSRLKDELGRKPTLDEYQKYIDNLTDHQVINNVLFKHPSVRTPRNAYAYDYYDHIKKNNTNSSKIAEKLRYNMKYIFGLPMLPMLNNNRQEN